MKGKVIIILLVFVSLGACHVVEQKVSFKAEIIEVQKDTFLVVPTKKYKSIGGRIIVTRKPKSTKRNLDFEVGDVIKIVHDGLILESEPAQLSVVYDIIKE